MVTFMKTTLFTKTTDIIAKFQTFISSKQLGKLKKARPRISSPYETSFFVDTVGCSVLVTFHLHRRTISNDGR